MGYNYTRARRVFHRQLRRFGGPAADEALLLRDGVTRRCRAARSEYKPHERGLHLEGASRILISARSLADHGSAPPRHDLDEIFFAGAIYKIVAPVTGPRQDDPTVIYYDCEVVYSQTATYIRGEEYLEPITMRMGFDEDALAHIVQPIYPGVFGIGFDMYPTPIAQATNFISAALDFGFEMAPTPLLVTEQYLSAAFDFGYDIEIALPGEQFIFDASFSIGFDLEGAGESYNNIPVTFSFGLDVGSTFSIEQPISVAFGLGFDEAVVLTSTAGDTGDATATLSDTTPNTGQTITVNFADNDPDGPATGITYTLRNQTDGTTLAGPQASNSFIVPQAALNKALRGRVNYTDAGGTAEQIETASSTNTAQGTQSNTITHRGQAATNAISAQTITLGAGGFTTVAIVVEATQTGSSGIPNISGVTNNQGLTFTERHSVGADYSVQDAGGQQIKIYTALTTVAFAGTLNVGATVSGQSGVKMKLFQVAHGSFEPPANPIVQTAQRAWNNASTSAPAIAIDRGNSTTGLAVGAAGAPNVQTGIADLVTTSGTTLLNDQSDGVSQFLTGHRTVTAGTGSVAVGADGSGRENIVIGVVFTDWPK